MATISNITSPHTVFKRLNEMSYRMGIDSCTSGKVCYTRLADPDNLRNNDYTHFFRLNPIECIQFLLQQPAFRKCMLYAPAKESNNGEECICSEVNSCDWWWNEQVLLLNFIIATMILTSSMTTAAAWSYDCPCIRQLRPDTSYTPFRRQERMGTIFESRKHWLDYEIRAFESCKHPCCPSSCSSGISL